jgi:signal recognition particle GTPase
VLVGAADTFRAGAIDQLRVWAQRAKVDFVGAPRDPIPRRLHSMRSTPASLADAMS